MSQTLTRRSLLSAAPAAIVAAAIPAQAGAHPDAALLALREPWLATLADFNTALDLKSVAEGQVFERCESFPDLKTFAGSLDEYSATCARITAQRKAVAAEIGSEEADSLEDATSEANTAIVDRITEIPARTLAGLAFKVEVSEDWSHGREELIDSIMDDIVSLAKGGLDA